MNVTIYWNVRTEAKNIMKRQLLVILATALAAALLLSTTATRADGLPVGRVRIIHASVGTPNLDIYLNRGATPAMSNLAYGSATGFFSLPADTYVITIRATGSPSNSDPIFQRNFTISADSALNMVAVGQLTRQGSRGFLLVLVPANLAPSAVGFARIQVINAAPQYGTIDVYVNNVLESLQLMYGDGWFDGLDVNPGAYTLTALPSTEQPAGKPKPWVINLANWPLSANTSYTVIEYGISDVGSGLHTMILTSPLKPYVKPDPASQS